jgi:hypothetical protein
VLLAHLLLAQLTLVLTMVLYVTGRVTRWRLQWLAVPAGVGLVWLLAVGPSRAAAGLTAGPRQVLDYLGGIGRHPGHLLHLFDAFAGLTRWLPEQLPLALILAAAETFGLLWLRLYWQQRRGRQQAWRTGLIVTARRGWNTASLRAGGVVSSDGCRLGIDVTTGRAAGISWQEAEGGVLCAGPAADLGLAAAAESGFRLAHAAIRRRKPLIVIDLTGSAPLARSLATACTEPGAPLWSFGPAGPGCYEPLRGGDPARAASLVMAMLDWSETGDQQRRSCAAYLTDALAVQAAAPRDRRLPLLDDLLSLLTPEGLRERAALIPGYHPRRDVLADRASVSAGLLQADPATVATPAEQLPRLRSSALGQWLRPTPEGGARISLGQTVRQRGVTLFSLERDVHGMAARMIAALAAADLVTVCAELQAMSVPGDSLVWINGCEVLEQLVLAELVTRGQGAGMAVVLGTASAAVAEQLAAEVNVLVARGPVDAALAGCFASTAGGSEGSPPRGSTAETVDATAVGLTEATFGVNGGDPFTVDALAQAGDGFAMMSRAPQRRVLARCRHVPARVRAAPAGFAPGGAGSAGFGPRDAARAGFGPGGAAPAGFGPGGAAPAGFGPGGAAPAGFGPGGAAPAGFGPGGVTPDGLGPGSAAPAARAPGGAAPMPAPVGPASADDAAASSASADVALADAAAAGFAGAGPGSVGSVPGAGSAAGWPQ